MALVVVNMGIISWFANHMLEISLYAWIFLMILELYSNRKNEKSNKKPTSSNELKIYGTTLIRIKNGKIESITINENPKKVTDLEW